MRLGLKLAALAEIEIGKNFFLKGEPELAFIKFERAHVLGQASPYIHTLSHLWMLRVAFHQLDIKEIMGQVIRIPLGLIGSTIGLVPKGNTGGVNVGLFHKMPIPPDLQKILDQAD